MYHGVESIFFLCFLSLLSLLYCLPIAKTAVCCFYNSHWFLEHGTVCVYGNCTWTWLGCFSFACACLASPHIGYAGTQSGMRSSGLLGTYFSTIRYRTSINLACNAHIFGYLRNKLRNSSDSPIFISFFFCLPNYTHITNQFSIILPVDSAGFDDHLLTCMVFCMKQVHSVLDCRCVGVSVSWQTKPNLQTILIIVHFYFIDAHWHLFFLFGMVKGITHGFYMNCIDSCSYFLIHFCSHIILCFY